MSPIAILPTDFEAMLGAAVATFWRSRDNRSTAQEGTRGAVIGGKNLDGFIAVVHAIAAHCGLPATAVIASGRSDLTVPGYFRPTKNWDVLVMHRGRLLAALEFKSQVGSFGNNFNNRCEEAIGLATDLQLAVDQGLLQPSHHRTQSDATDASDPRPPFLGYLLLLEAHPRALKAVVLTSPHYPVDPVFESTSYADRYRILCERLMSQRLFSAAALMLSPQDAAGAAGAWQAMSPATSPLAFFRSLAGSLLAAADPGVAE